MYYGTDFDIYLKSIAIPIDIDDHYYEILPYSYRYCYRLGREIVISVKLDLNN